jgi:centriolar protein POC1
MVWNFKPNMRPFRFIGHKGQVYSVAVSQSGQTIVSGSEDHTIRIWKNSVEGTSHVVKTHSSAVKTVALSNDASMILSGSNDKTLKVTSL